MRYILEIIHIDGSTESVPCDATRETLGWIHAYGRQYSEATGRIGRPHLGAWPASALRKYTKVDTAAPAVEPRPWIPYAQRPHRA